MDEIIDLVGYDSEDTTTRILFMAMVTLRPNGQLAITTSDYVREPRLLYNSRAVKDNRQTFEIDATFKLGHVQAYKAVRMMPEHHNNGLLGIYMPNGVFMLLRDGSENEAVKHRSQENGGSDTTSDSQRNRPATVERARISKNKKDREL